MGGWGLREGGGDGGGGGGGEKELGWGIELDGWVGGDGLERQDQSEGDHCLVRQDGWIWKKWGRREGLGQPAGDAEEAGRPGIINQAT